MDDCEKPNRSPILQFFGKHIGLPPEIPEDVTVETGTYCKLVTRISHVYHVFVNTVEVNNSVPSKMVGDVACCV